MRKIINFKTYNLNVKREKELLLVPARHMYVIKCDDDVYVSFNSKEDEVLNLKSVKYIDLAGIRELYITNEVGSGELVLLFTPLLKIELV